MATKVGYMVGHLTGRCVNGAQRDSGLLYHALPIVRIEAWGPVYSSTAACGITFGRRSAGWNTDEGQEVTCPKCLRKLAAAELRSPAAANEVAKETKDA